MELTADKKKSRRKNDSEDAKKRKEEAYRYFKEYCEYSGIHGFRYLTEERTLWERVWWIIALLLSVAFSGYMIYEIADKYLQYPVRITFSMQEEHINKIPFPAVTICPITNLVRDYFELNRTDEMKSEMWKALANTHINHTEAFYNIVNESAPHNLVNCGYREKWYSCKFLFTPILTEHGVCYSFNILDKTDIFRDDVFSLPGYHGRPQTKWNIEEGYKISESDNPYPVRTFEAGIANGIGIALRTKIVDIEYDCKSQDSGYWVAVHLPSKVPQIAESYFIVPLNQNVVGQIIPSLIKTSSGVKAFSTKKRDCYFEEERPLKYFKIYNLENCLMECKTNITLQNCSCTAYFMPRHNDTPICAKDKTICMREAVFNVTLAHLKNNELKCGCLPTCTDLTYNLEISQNTLESKPQCEQWRVNESYKYSKLNLYFKRNRMETKQREEVYDFSDFVSNFGGLLGLFTGFSILSLVEIMYFLSLRIWGNIKIHRNWNGQNNTISNECLY